jgi:hypothetical protein
MSTQSPVWKTWLTTASARCFTDLCKLLYANGFIELTLSRPAYMIYLVLSEMWQLKGTEPLLVLIRILRDRTIFMSRFTFRH